MSQNRKSLKLISFALVVLSLVTLFVGVAACMAAGGAPEAEHLLDLEPGVYYYLTGGLLAVCAVVGLACSWKGIMGANRPSNLGSHRALAFAGIVLGLLAGLFCTDSGDVTPIPVSVTIALLVLEVVYGGKVKKESER